MSSNIYGAPFEMEEITLPIFYERVVYAKDYCDKGKEEDKSVIQRAVNACHELGGGMVVVAAGEWVTGPIHLHSNIHLRFEKDAVIHFSEEYSDYLPVVFTRWEGMEGYNYSPLIYAKDCTNIAITGEGTLLGHGQAWWHWKRLQQDAANRLCYAESMNIPVEDRIFGTKEDALRPSFIQPIGCKNVLIEGLTIKDGPQWMIHPVYCEDVIVRNVRVISNGHNTDGLNPDSCNRVLIEDCYFSTGDDCIAINSGMNEDGWRVNKPCQNIIIRNCVMENGHGGVVIGSGMSGGVSNIYAKDITISGTHQGIRLKSMRGRGGYVENIWFEDVTINNLLKEAIVINMFYTASTVIPKTNKPSDFDNIHIKNVSGKGSDIAIEIIGLPEHHLKSISLENIELQGNRGMVCSDVESVSIKGLTLYTEEKKKVEFVNVGNLNIQDMIIK